MKKINKKKHSIFVGMDVDKDYIDVAVGEEGRTTKDTKSRKNLCVLCVFVVFSFHSILLGEVSNGSELAKNQFDLRLQGTQCGALG